MAICRRTFLALSATVPFGAVALSARAAEPACFDPASLSLSEQSQRKSLNFRDQSSDPKRRCGACTFFNSEDRTCGTCQLMAGAPVTVAGVCDSFAAKQGQ